MAAMKHGFRPLMSSSPLCWTATREYHRVHVWFMLATNPTTEFAFWAPSWYVSTPQIIRPLCTSMQSQITTTATPRWLGSVVVGHRTCDREVTGSTPAAALFGQQALGKLFTPNVPLFTKQYNLVPCEGLHAKAPYCGSGIGSNEQGKYCRAVLKRFCLTAKNHDINHLFYFYFTFTCQ